MGKHGVSFQEASTAFEDTLSLTIDDPLHSNDEKRLVLIGMSYNNRILVIVHTERGDNIRIISARKATKKERKYYESNV
ncbi:MAG: BrnT family toxin [Deltaproteobacteria bacterium]|nr:BrnT family toxin [Deltaproteobacteria bacterium]